MSFLMTLKKFLGILGEELSDLPSWALGSSSNGESLRAWGKSSKKPFAQARIEAIELAKESLEKLLLEQLDTLLPLVPNVQIYLKIKQMIELEAKIKEVYLSKDKKVYVLLEIPYMTVFNNYIKKSKEHNIQRELCTNRSTLAS